MNFTLGVYDLFTYTVPGSLYVTLATYIAYRLAWIDPSRVLQVNTTIVIIAAGVLSYIIGHITYRLGYLLSRAYGHDKDIDEARGEFANRVPTANDRPFLKAHRSILQAAVELHDAAAATEIVRLRSIGLMLRNSAPVFVLGAMAAVADVATGTHPIVSGVCVVIFLLVAVGCLSQSVVMRHWANMKTLELAYWVPDIDHNLNRDKPPAKRSSTLRPPSSKQETTNSQTATDRQARRQGS